MCVCVCVSNVSWASDSYQKHTRSELFYFTRVFAQAGFSHGAVHYAEARASVWRSTVFRKALGGIADLARHGV